MSRFHLTLSAILAALVVSSAPAQTAPYRFEVLAETQLSSASRFALTPAINDNGTAAFALPGPLNEGYTLHVGTPGAVQHVPTTTRHVAGTLGFLSYPRMSSAGDWAFHRAGDRIIPTPTLVTNRTSIDQGGVYTKIAETLKSFEEITDGRADDLPERAFLYAADIAEVRAKAKAMA